MIRFATCLMVLIAALASPAASGLEVVGVPDEAGLKGVQTRDAELSVVYDPALGRALHVELGTTKPWPGVGFAFAGGLDASAHGDLRFTLRNAGAAHLHVRCRIDSRSKTADEGAERSQLHHVSLAPGERQQVSIPLVPYVEHPGVSPGDFFGMRGVPFFPRNAVHLANITQIRLFVEQDGRPRAFEVGELRLAGVAAPRPAAPPSPVFPMIDALGQFKHKDWPGKTRSVDALVGAEAAEARVLTQTSRPASWNRYGGWKNGPQLDATGWFRTAKHAGRWTLVDPDGRLFFSLGIDGVGFKRGTIVDDRHHWFDTLPPDNTENGDFYSSWKPDLKRSHFYGRSVRVFSFQKYNASRKYGPDWRERFAERCVQRLPAWGINTLGNWSAADIASKGVLPYVGYVRPASKPIAGSSGHWGKFKDVFDPSFEASLRKQLGRGSLAAATRDPMCIGFFVDNELTFGDETSLAEAALESPSDQAAKRELVEDLKHKYGEIDALNRVWGSGHASWDGLLAHEGVPGDGARADLVAFNVRLIRAYFSTVRRVLKELAPNHLYLGCRYGSSAPILPAALAANAEFSDVVSFNVYSRFLADKRSRLERAGDKPYLIGEFHFGALDRGMFDTGLVEVASQAERAEAFSRFVADCVAHPNIVGCHWFQFVDSPNTGRPWDHENYQIGFTDICDTPYAELIEASRRAGETLYE